jgi:hypothetical protein
MAIGEAQSTGEAKALQAMPKAQREKPQRERL